MITFSLTRLEQVEKRFQTIEHQLTQDIDPSTYASLASDYAELQELVMAIRNWKKANHELNDIEQLLKDTNADSDMKIMAQEEKLALQTQIEELAQQIKLLMLPKDESDSKNVILEIRAGTGGLEAALFAGDLFRMYEKYAASKKWKVEIVSTSEGDAGGFKEIIASISGKSVFSYLKFESGVHRVQRVPDTEASGRIHTSAATVAVLPEAEEIDIEIKNEDIRIDTMRASGAGGQHVNTTDSAVRITHIPTGIIVVQAEKSQHQNRERAMQVLRSRLYDMQRQQAEAERSAHRKGQVGSGDRSERIRTYNFPQGRVTDHRINLTLYKLDKILEGDLNELISALITDQQSKLLAEMDQ
ncbi:peptide chain release factor 1 [Bartonella sp. DGB1]|uniref:peptide chain release factor 1 n=1 Tax=Bartonella sp. DGB1 TaxID=3239807 RepID=UPI003525D9E9